MSETTKKVKLSDTFMTVEERMQVSVKRRENTAFFFLALALILLVATITVSPGTTAPAWVVISFLAGSGWAFALSFFFGMIASMKELEIANMKK